MKNLSIDRWREAYADLPTYYQRYWLQLWLEILDPDTDYLFDLGTTNIRYLLEELIKTPASLPIRANRVIDNTRTLFFLVCEIESRLGSAVALRHVVGEGLAMFRSLPVLVARLERVAAREDEAERPRREGRDWGWLVPVAALAAGVLVGRLL